MRVVYLRKRNDGQPTLRDRGAAGSVSVKIVRMLRARGMRASARRSARSANWQAAADVYRNLVRMGGAAAGDRVQFGHVLKEAGHITAAEEAYWEAAAAFPRHFDAQMHHGLFLKAIQKRDEAGGVLARALALKADDAFVRAELAQLEIEGDVLDAVSLTGILGSRSAAPPRPGPIGRAMVAVGLYQARRHARARRWVAAANVYRRLVAVDPHNQRLLIQLGHALREQGDGANAVAAYRNALVGDPHVAEAYLHLGHALKMVARGAAAIQCYLTAWRLQPGMPAAAAELRSLGYSDHDLKQVAQQTWGGMGTGDAMAAGGRHHGPASVRLSPPHGLTAQQTSIWMLLAANVGNRN